MQAAIYMLMCRSENENRFFLIEIFPFQKRLNTRLLPHLQAFKHIVLLSFYIKSFKKIRKVTLYRAIKLLRISCELHMLMFNNVLFNYVYSKSYQTPFFIPIHLKCFPWQGKLYHLLSISERR